jgi:hypothetical protein
MNNVLLDLQNEGSHIYGCVDDIVNVVSGHFLTTIRELVDKALKITERWWKTKSLVVNLSKINIMVITWKYKPEPRGPLKLGKKGDCIHLLSGISGCLH